MGRLFRSLKKAASDFGEDDCMSNGAAIAYYAIFSLPPLLVLLLMIAGYFGVEPDRIQAAVQNQWGVASGKNDSSEEAKTDQESEKAEEEEPKPGQFGILSRIVGGAILLFSATGLFAQLQYALNRAWEVKPDPQQGGIWAFITKRVLSFSMVLVVAFLLLISFVLTTIIDELVALLQGSSPEGPALALGIVLNNVAAFAVATLLFAAMYKLLPDAKMAWKDAFVGVHDRAIVCDRESTHRLVFATHRFSLGMGECCRLDDRRVGVDLLLVVDPAVRSGADAGLGVGLRPGD
jgi:membrane protein